MTRPRKAQVSLIDTPYYHITSRCVRRAFLCGVDHYSGKSYEHRRQWVVDRIRTLSSLFAIDICSYAVMNNHYHLVLKVCPEQLSVLTNEDVLERWCSLFKGPLLVQRYRAGRSLAKAERETISDIINVWRQRLGDLSWFMRCLNQPIAQQANREDGCTGKFWESRFTSQALRTEEALLSCMAYVDLNPVRANIAKTPETSDYTSIQERISRRFDLTNAVTEQLRAGELMAFEQTLKPLLHFDGSISNNRQTAIPFHYHDYLSLVDWTGRAMREDKRGAIPKHLPPILERLSISPKRWLNSSQQFEHLHRRRFYNKPPVASTG